MNEVCDHSYVYLIVCGAMACIACAHHTSLENYAAMRERPPSRRSRRYCHDECNCGWAEDTKEGR
jgi:hypothetical protein